MDDRVGEMADANETEMSLHSESGDTAHMANMDQHEGTTAHSSARPQGPSRPTSNPEIVRRAPDIPSAGGRRPGSEDSDKKKLTVGREIVLSGEINSCDYLVVEGRVEANISDCRELEIAESGMFKGAAEIDVADISGRFEGTLIARQLLLVRSTGRISGNVKYGQLEIERGGELAGDIHTVEGGPRTDEKPATAAE